PAAPVVDHRDFFFLEEEDPVAAARLIRDLVLTRLPRRYGLSPHEVQVLTPMHRGDLGAGSLNQLLQEALTSGAPGLTRGGLTLREGDKVMQIRNDYGKEVWNGDIGRVERVSRPGGDGGATGPGAAPAEGGGADQDGPTVTVRFDDREVVYGLDELDELRLA